MLPEVLPVISGDRTRLMQVILNILKTALRRSTSILPLIHRPACTGGTRLDDHPDRRQRTWICPQTGEQLFKRGFTTKSSGSGLRLSSCRAIVEAHEGEITIESEGEGKGATTTIKLKT